MSNSLALLGEERRCILAWGGVVEAGFPGGQMAAALSEALRTTCAEGPASQVLTEPLPSA